MSLRAYWAYAFTSDKSIEQILAAFNDRGPWVWELRDSACYGDYLNTQPRRGVRVRIHEFPSQSSEAGVLGVGYQRGYTALLQISDTSWATKGRIDSVLRRLLSKIGAQQVREIEPYD